MSFLMHYFHTFVITIYVHISKGDLLTRIQYVIFPRYLIDTILNILQKKVNKK